MKKWMKRFQLTGVILRNHRAKFAITLMVFSLVSFFLPMMVPVMIQTMMDRVESQAIFTAKSMLVILGVTIMALVLDYLVNVYGNVMCANLIYQGASNLYKEFFALPYQERESRYKEEEMLQHITAFTDASLTIWVLVVRIGVGVLVTLALIIFSACIHPIVVVALVVHVMVTLWSSRKINLLTEHFAQETQACEAEKNKNMQEVVYQAEFVVMHGLQDRLRASCKEIREQLFAIQKAQLQRYNLVNSLHHVLTELAGVLVYPFLYGKKISAGDLGAFRSTISQASMEGKSIYELSSMLPMNSVPLDNGADLLGIKRTVVSEAAKDASCIVVEHASLSIQDRCLLSDLHCTIQKGQHVAIIGENGSGKSTFLRLLMGMYQPTTGDVCVFGQHPYQKLDTTQMRACAYMPASSQLFEDSIDANIGMGASTEEVISLDCIKEMTGIAEFDADAHASISELSGGQKQRVNAARAIANVDAALYLFDEPTNSLDEENARNMMESIRHLDATVIYTTHRLNELAYADQVIKMNGGSIIEIGAAVDIQAKPTIPL